jgi:uncharacterized Zn finger protein (UPF0148 family)
MPKCIRCGKVKPRYKGSTLCSACYKRAKGKTHMKIESPFKYKL